MKWYGPAFTIALRCGPCLCSHILVKHPAFRGWVIIMLPYLSNVSPASTSVLPLAIEEHCCHRGSKSIKCGEVSCIEIWSPSWCIYCLPDGLAEEYKSKTMYSCSWFWAFITDDFISCNKIRVNMLKVSSF